MHFLDGAYAPAERTGSVAEYAGVPAQEEEKGLFEFGRCAVVFVWFPSIGDAVFLVGSSVPIVPFRGCAGRAMSQHGGDKVPDFPMKVGCFISALVAVAGSSAGEDRRSKVLHKQLSVLRPVGVCRIKRWQAGGVMIGSRTLEVNVYKAPVV